MSDQVTVTYVLGSETKKVTGKKGQTILQISQENDIPQTSACGGMGICTTCMCMVQENPQNLGEATEAELNMGIDGQINRLGCQSTVKGDVTIAL